MRDVVIQLQSHGLKWLVQALAFSSSLPKVGQVGLRIQGSTTASSSSSGVVGDTNIIIVVVTDSLIVATSPLESFGRATRGRAAVIRTWEYLRPISPRTVTERIHLDEESRSSIAKRSRQQWRYGWAKDSRFYSLHGRYLFVLAANIRQLTVLDDPMHYLCSATLQS